MDFKSSKINLKIYSVSAFMRVSGHAQGTIASSPNLQDSLEVGWPFDISSRLALASSFPFLECFSCPSHPDTQSSLLGHFPLWPCGALSPFSGHLQPRSSQVPRGTLENSSSKTENKLTVCFLRM